MHRSASPHWMGNVRSLHYNPFYHKFSSHSASLGLSERAMSPGECMSWHLCPLALYESWFLHWVEKERPHLYSLSFFLVLFQLVSWQDCYQEEYQCKQGVKCAPSKAIQRTGKNTQGHRTLNSKYKYKEVDVCVPMYIATGHISASKWLHILI